VPRLLLGIPISATVSSASSSVSSTLNSHLEIDYNQSFTWQTMPWTQLGRSLDAARTAAIWDGIGARSLTWPPRSCPHCPTWQFVPRWSGSLLEPWRIHSAVWTSHSACSTHSLPLKLPGRIFVGSSLGFLPTRFASGSEGGGVAKEGASPQERQCCLHLSLGWVVQLAGGGIGDGVSWVSCDVGRP